MLMQHHPIRELRSATIALFLAAGFEGLRQIVLPGFSVWQSHIAIPLLCASLVFLLIFELLCNGQPRAARLEVGPTFSGPFVKRLLDTADISNDGGRLRRWPPNFEGVDGNIGPEIAEMATGDKEENDQRESSAPEVSVDLRKLKRAEDSLRESEEQYRVLVANIPEVVWKTDANGNVIFVSPQVETILGYSSEEFRRRGDSLWFNSVHPDDKEKVGKAFESLIHEGKSYDLECRARRKNGEWFWAHDRAVATVDANGDRVATGLLSDITARKAGEEMLQKLASVVEYSEDAIIGKDVDGVITSWNRAAEKMYGYTGDEAVGRNVSFLLPPERRAEIPLIMERIRSGQPTECLETERLTKTGSVLDVSLTISPIKDAAGRITGASSIARDISLRKRSEEQLLLQSAALEAAANAIVITDHEGKIVWVNHAFTTMTGYGKQDVLGRNPSLLKSGEQSASYYADLWSTILSGKVWKGQLVNRRKDGSTYTEEMTITPVMRDASNPANRYFIAIKQDVSERKRSEGLLQDSENKYRVLFEDSADANLLMDEKGFLKWNSAALEMFGYSAGNLNLHPADISPPNQPDGTSSLVAAEQKIAAAFRRGTERFEWLHQRKSGEVFLAEVCLTALTLSGRPTLLANIRDISQRKQAEESLLFKNALLEAQAETTIDGILAVDESDHIVLTNRQLGLSFEIPDDVMSTCDDVVLRKYVSDQIEDPEAFLEKVKYLYSHRNEKSRDELRLKNGKVLDRYSAPLVDSKGQYRGRIWYFRDITDRKLAEQQVQFLAYYDALTRLPNRTLLQDRLGKALAEARRHNCKVALLFLDLDRFKDINDSLGHSVGDLLLQAVAERLKVWGREQDTVARLGGDEFLLMLTGLKDLPDAAVAAERLMDAMSAEFVIEGHSLTIGCSLGISIFPEHGTDCETLIKNADAAMYCAKDNGRNNFRFFTADINAQVMERLTLEHSLRGALEKKQLFLMYQPQVDIASGNITGMEALIRWQHPEMGLVPPDKFIRIAENSGLIMPIGEWVLRTACLQAQKWQDAGLPAVSIAVNVSAVQFRQEGFCDLIRKVLQDTRLSPQYLELELTESLLLANADVMFSVVQELKAMGVTLAIDDFGTGYSSFSYLRQFHVSKLKIDRMFIRDVAVKPDDAAITTAIISMAKSLNLKVIAEGVENEAQMSFLRAHHCDEIQGYYFSKPLTADRAADKLRGGHLELQAKGQAIGIATTH
jgi:diguanylate cyclase (GGDEF)-like protein/PAS domain S-box-containing protein